MVSKVINDRHAVLHALDFQTTSYTLKALERFNSLLGVDPDVMRSGNGSQRILRVVHACSRHLGQRALHGRAQTHNSIVVHAPTRGRIELFNSAPASHAQHALERFALGIDNHKTIAGNGAHQVMELLFDGSQIFKDVGVVVLEIVKNRRRRTIVHKLAALVEKGRIVFVGFDHEILALSQASRGVRAKRHSADQPAGLQTRLGKNMQEH